MRECPYCGRSIYGDNLHCQECIRVDDDDEYEPYLDAIDDEPYDPIKDPDNYSPEGFKTIKEHNEFWEAFFESQNSEPDNNR